MSRKGVKKSISLILILLVGMVLISGIAMAQEKARKESKIANFFRKLFGWPVKVTEKAAETVIETTEKGAKTVVETGKATVEVITGEPQKFDEMIMEPIKGAAETGVTAVEGTIRAPVEATQETLEE